MDLRWFGFKSVMLVEPSGKPDFKDKYYSKSTRLVEERIILIRAKSEAEAIKNGFKDAENYCRDKYVNIYGEILNYRFTGMYYIYEMDDQPDNLVEVFSTTELHFSKSDALKASKRKIGLFFERKKSKYRKRFRQR